MGCRVAVAVIAKAKGLWQSKIFASGAWLARGSSRFQAPGGLIEYGLGNAVFS